MHDNAVLQDVRLRHRAQYHHVLPCIVLCLIDVSSPHIKKACYTCSVGRVKRDMAEMCVKAVLAVADLKRKDVNLDLIKVPL